MNDRPTSFLIAALVATDFTALVDVAIGLVVLFLGASLFVTSPTSTSPGPGTSAASGSHGI